MVLWTSVPMLQLFYCFINISHYGLPCGNCFIVTSMDWCTYATIVLSILHTYFIDLWTGVPMRQLFYQY